MTCGHFLHCELQPHQTAARDAFVKCYLEASPRGTAWDKLPAQRVQSFEEGSGSKLDEAEGAFLEGSLRSMMKYLDEYFFFGTMTRLQEGQQYLLLALETGFGRLKADVAEGRYGDTQIYRTHWDNTDQPYARVRLWSRLACDSPQSRDGGRRIRRLSFARNVATLIHELVHAYLGIFVCAGAQCRRNILNTTGVTGHASTFTKLYALVLGEVREWHPELGSLNKHECIPGTSIVSHNIAFEAAARQQWRSDGRDRGLLPLRADSPRNLVRQTEEVINGISVMSITYRRPGSRIPGQEEADGSCDVDGV
ncbi:uncharacterized protein GLRG_02964 [Colletotrichum graminicola M1.001]|uniref:SprT-like domain-containing protein n=1 Tax=Colletotrichum graminicola (strain M1.001 / M2 / FGSC 10212) TaxID=645133 RepID=E3QAD2_COLGM|nr:uncharacterized protein GLRG_02964 [Colletotrichum graminicola M1.001]EFQ27820.1 hypothetical protein GLRG_02964 [Colletotrichum graminicola M1.001]